MGASSSNGNNRTSVEISKNGNSIVVIDGVQIITLGESTSDTSLFTFIVDEGEMLYAAGSSKNYLKTGTGTGADFEWEITISNGIATIKAKNSTNRNILRYNESSNLFSCYASGQKDVAVYTTGYAVCTSHTSTDDNDCTTALVCNKCGFVIVEAASAHTPENDDGNCMTEVKCSVCDVITTAAREEHDVTDDNDCTTPTVCAVCKTVTVEALNNHDFSGDWVNSPAGHWHVCQNEGCSGSEEVSDHISGGPATAEDDEVCTVCDYIITPALGCAHENTSILFNEEKHWIKCSSCNAEFNHTPHTAEDDDNDCTTPLTCSGCDYVITAATDHTPENVDSDCTTPVTCSVCNTTITAAQTHDFTGNYTYDNDGHWHICGNTGCTLTDTKESHDFTSGDCTCGQARPVLSIKEALEAEPSEEKYYISGIITSITNEEYGNMYIADDEGNIIQIYGLYKDGAKYDEWDEKLSVGDYITVLAYLYDYKGTNQLGHSDAEFIEKSEAPEGHKNALAVLRAEESLALEKTSYSEDALVTLPTADDVTVTWTVEGAELNSDGKLVITQTSELQTIKLTANITAGSFTKTKEFTISVSAKVEGGGDEPIIANGTLSFDTTTNRTELSTSKQVWQQNGITLTNDKASSTTNIADYSNPARFYKSSNLTITCPGKITKIVFTCNTDDYATTLESSIAGATVSVSDSDVTVVFDSPVESFTVALSSGQVRMNSLKVYYIECVHSEIKKTVDATCTEIGYTVTVCTICGTEIGEKVKIADALGHSYDDGVVSTEATCTQKGVKTFTCATCNGTVTEDIEALGHTTDNGVCGNCGQTIGDDTKPVETTMSIFANKGTTGTDTISWTSDGVTFTNNKGTTAIRTSDSDHYRIYANSEVVISSTKMTKIVITATSGSYATVLESSISAAGYTVTVSGSVVTVTLESVDTITFTASAQTRINKIVVTHC